MSNGLWSRVGGKLQIRLHSGQAAVHRSLARFILVLAGTQGGKTSYGPIWLWQEINKWGTCGNETGDYLAASANYDVLRLKMLPELTAWFCGVWGWTYQASDKVFVSPDKKIRIILRSADAPAGLESCTAIAAWLDEWGLPSVGIECWEAVLRRLSLATDKGAGRALLTTTPYNMGWIKQIHDRAVGGNPDYALVNFKSTDNPAFPQAEYDRAKREMPAWRHSMFYDGKLTRPAGVIYTDYEDSYATFDAVANPNNSTSTLPGPGRYLSGGCLVEPFTIPPHWLRTVGVDFGSSIHNALIWVAEDPHTRLLYAYRESCGIDNSGPEQARSASQYKEPVRVAYGGAKSEDERRREWSIAGFPVSEPLIADVEAGIDRVTGLFKQRRLFIFDTLTGLRSELGSYSRELDDAGNPLEKIAKKETFHRIDSLRYLASGFELLTPAELMPPVINANPRSSSVDPRFLPPRETEEYY